MVESDTVMTVSKLVDDTEIVRTPEEAESSTGEILGLIGNQTVSGRTEIVK